MARYSGHDLNSAMMIYERDSECGPHEALYVIPVTSILGKLPVVPGPVGDTVAGTIPYTLRESSVTVSSESLSRAGSSPLHS